MIKAGTWNGKDLKGTWEVTLKIDGVRALWTTPDGGPSTTLMPAQWMSRNGKPLCNIPPPPSVQYRDAKPPRPTYTDVEVYLGPQYGDQKARFAATIRAVRSQAIKTTGCRLKRCKCEQGDPIWVAGTPCPLGKWVEATPPVTPEDLYSLDPLDPRLHAGILHGPHGAGQRITLLEPIAANITLLMTRAVELGYEGLVLRQGDKWLKVKPVETYDVRILSVHEGVGKRKGHVGYFMTAKGKVGGFKGLSYGELKGLWDIRASLPGQTIEVECLHLTPKGQFRLPRFIRFRPDKDAEE